MTKIVNSENNGDYNEDDNSELQCEAFNKGVWASRVFAILSQTFERLLLDLVLQFQVVKL